MECRCWPLSSQIVSGQSVVRHGPAEVVVVGRILIIRRRQFSWNAKKFFWKKLKKENNYMFTTSNSSNVCWMFGEWNAKDIANIYRSIKTVNKKIRNVAVILILGSICVYVWLSVWCYVGGLLDVQPGLVVQPFIYWSSFLSSSFHYLYVCKYDTAESAVAIIFNRILWNASEINENL